MPVPRARGADARGRLARGRGAVRERRDPGQGVDDERDDGRGVRRLHGSRRGPAGLRRARGRQGREGRARRRSRSTRTGSFETPLGLSTGKWQLTVTATSPEGKSTTLTRDISIRYQGVTLVVEIKNGRAWIKVWVDGKVSKVTGTRRQGLQPGQGADVHGEADDRGPDRASRARRTSRSTARTSAGCRTRATPRRGCSSRRGEPRPDRPQLTVGDPLVELAGAAPGAVRRRWG